MKHALILLPVCLATSVLVSSTCGGETGSGGLTPQQALRAWADAMESSDLERTVGFYDDSSDTIVFLSWGEKRTGLQEIRKEYEAAFKDVVFDEVTLESLSVHRYGQVSWAASVFKADATRRSDLTQWCLHIRTSFVLRQRGDTWKIVLEHFSPIAGVPRAQRRSCPGPKVSPDQPVGRAISGAAPPISASR